MNICNLAYDTSLVMKYGDNDLDILIQQVEEEMILKFQYKSCGLIAEHLEKVLSTLYFEEDLNREILQKEFASYKNYVKNTFLKEEYQEIMRIEQLQRIFSEYTEEDFIAAGIYDDPEALEEVQEALDFDVDEAYSNLKEIYA